MQQHIFEFTAQNETIFYSGEIPVWARDEKHGRTEAKTLILSVNPQWQDCLEIGELVAVI